MMAASKAGRMNVHRGFSKARHRRLEMVPRKGLVPTAYAPCNDDPQQYPDDLEEPDSDDAAACVSSPAGGLAVTISRIVELSHEQESDFEATRPTAYALRSIVILLMEAHALSGIVPAGSPSVDSRGGIRLTFRNQNRELRLVCPATDVSPPELYYQSDSDRDVEAATRENLAHRFEWLVS